MKCAGNLFFRFRFRVPRDTADHDSRGPEAYADVGLELDLIGDGVHGEDKGIGSIGVDRGGWSIEKVGLLDLAAGMDEIDSLSR